MVNGYRLVGNGVKRVVFSFSSSFLLGGMGGSGHLVFYIFHAFAFLNNAGTMGGFFNE